MSLVYSSRESAELIQALTKNLANGKDTINHLKAGSQQVIKAVDGQTLAGAAYMAGEGLFSDLIIPIIARVATACETIEQDLQHYQAADQLISSEGYLDEALLTQQIATKRAMKTSIDFTSNLVRTATRRNPLAVVLNALLDFQRRLTRMSEMIQEDIDELNQKLEKLYDFSSQTNGLFTNSLNDMRMSMQAVLVLNGTIVNGDGTYVLPEGTDKSWFTSLQSSTKIKKTAQKQAYLRLLQDQFGFDDITAKQIFKIKEGIDRNFPELSQKKRDYLFTRILGEFSYGEGLKNQLMWPNTAGSLSVYFYDEVTHYTGEILKSPKDLMAILFELGLSEKEYKELYYNLDLQHIQSPGNVAANKLRLEIYIQSKKNYEIAYGEISNEKFSQFWNQKLSDFGTKGDFTHQSITMATLLDGNLRLANLSGVITGRFDSKTVGELAGWRGDTTTVPAEKPSIGSDDYKADLDAVNIIHRMTDQNITYTQASSNYYYELINGQTNRAKEFKDNSDYNYVKNEILNDLAPKYEYTAGEMQYQTQYEGRPDAYNANTKRILTEQEKLIYVKMHYPASYNFIESLNNDKNEFTNYTYKGS
ncbi:hypothetical protein I6N95_04070 [Vagococcus sp. BWB3-3]|uniref:LXG domain-containing protein n=1 Tax=Vagococcus allomyrinae TaxID=2794353 RepID=A0A940SVC1_9ENTE|nr:T7SS effector LXG polymorphic toxin [Vagococcus allomyrinae]MBP1040183.1 hypothetical protein [Vagococcus allomyrinae]